MNQCATMACRTKNELSMSLLRLALKRETAAPMLALAFATIVCVALVIARMIWPGDLRNPVFLIWNLFLAWLPLVFSLLACDHYHKGPAQRWRFAGFAAAWLVFFPNAPYIFTDLIHVTQSYAYSHEHFWVDLLLILLCALTGLVLGFVSVFLMQALVRREFGYLASWVFIGLIAVVSGVGVYLGRIMRYNSWDVLLKPVSLYHGIDNWVTGPLAGRGSFTFPALFATFFFIAYIMLYALTQLRHFPATEPSPAPLPA
jgi:uncharacterized membrane protein